MTLRILVVDHGHSTRCGIRDLGVRIADRLDAIHVDCNNWDDYYTAINEYSADAIIVNYRPDLMPWWRPSSFPELAVLHNYSLDTVDQRAADLIDRGFDRVLVLDPTVMPTRPDVHAVGRPLPAMPRLAGPCRAVPHPAKPGLATSSEAYPRIGSFGFMFGHKGFGHVADEIVSLGVPATYVLHAPEAFFNGVGGEPLFGPPVLEDIRQRLNGSGVQLEYTADELSPAELVERLGVNDVNCLLYEPGQPDAGLSSALDYLVAARRPILVSSAAMFAAAQGCAAVWPDKRLADILDDLGRWEQEAEFLWAKTDGLFEADVRAIVDAL